jgi:hypothetical protein
MLAMCVNQATLISSVPSSLACPLAYTAAPDLHVEYPALTLPCLETFYSCIQDIQAVEDAKQSLQQKRGSLPEGFVRVVQMKAARANATQVRS